MSDISFLPEGRVFEAETAGNKMLSRSFFAGNKKAPKSCDNGVFGQVVQQSIGVSLQYCLPHNV